MNPNLSIGVKLTHDAAVALVAEGRLRFSIEAEKIANAPRHSIFESLSEIHAILDYEGVYLAHRNEANVVFDGWYYGASRRHPFVKLAPYHEGDAQSGETRPWGDVFRPAKSIGNALSFPHVAGHIVGSYAMSPWARDRRSAYSIVWDGGTGPRLYFVDPKANKPIQFLSHLGFLNGTLYGVMGYYAGPYKDQLQITETDYLGRRDWPGKLMSWLGKGRPLARLLTAMAVVNLEIEADMMATPSVFRNSYIQNGHHEHRFMRAVMTKAHEIDASDEDILASVHTFLEDLLVSRAVAAIPRGARLNFSGGSALNIKWNAALRNSGHFSDVFIPPTVNDSGAAIGMAACREAYVNGRWDLEWNVYCGPALGPAPTVLPEGWERRTCSLYQLAAELVAPERPEPVVVLEGRAEIGPRALGHRSLLMDPRRPDARDVLNALKGREPWRPVSPMILEEDVGEWFEDGPAADPYMLYDRVTRRKTLATFPAVVHEDGTSRVQTVGPDDGSPFVRDLLCYVKQISGTGMLCNTSANLNGSGFFPDVASAIAWGKVGRIYSDGYLYTKGGGS